MKRILAAALLVSPFAMDPAFAAVEKPERSVSCIKDGAKTACDQNEDTRISINPKPAVDISVRIRSPWAKIDIRLNFG